MITIPDKPVSKKTRRWPMWAVIRTAGAGSIVATAHDASNAMLRAAVAYTHDNHVDYKRWWTLNQQKHALVLARIVVEAPTYRDTTHQGWASKPPAERCEWDTGGLVECQCHNLGKHTSQGRRLCGTHLNIAQRSGELRLITPLPKGTNK